MWSSHIQSKKLRRRDVAYRRMNICIAKYINLIELKYYSHRRMHHMNSADFFFMARLIFFHFGNVRVILALNNGESEENIAKRLNNANGFEMITLD